MNTKEKIIQITSNLIFEKGYKNISLNEIAEKVGIKKPSIYHYFQCKEDIYKVVINDFIDNFEKQVDNILKSNKKSYQKIKEFILLCMEPVVNKKNLKFLIIEKIFHENYSENKNKEMLQRRNDLFKKMELIISEYAKDKKLQVTNREIIMAIIGTIVMFIADRVFIKEEIISLKEVEAMADNIMFIIFNKI